jgi:7-carboxy-7-deazaguanine synthase
MLENIQPPEPFDRSTGSELDLHSIFYTIQGEGPFSGCPALFVRLAGCNLQCPFCDTEYTSGRHRVTLEQLMDKVYTTMPLACKLVVLTGGEPLRQNIAPFIALLARGGIMVQIESNGVLAIPDALALLLETPYVKLIVSPKTQKVSELTAVYATAFKYVLEHSQIDPEDGLPLLALGHKAKPRVARPPTGFRGEIYINPMDAQDPDENRRNVIAVRESSLKFGHRLGLQIHKLIDVA